MTGLTGRRGRRIIATSVALVLVAGCSSDSTSSAAVESVAATSSLPATTSTVAPMGSIRGTAYTFNTPDPIAGARVYIEEYPELSTSTAPDGSYLLDVPPGLTVTPVIEAEGHHSIHLQTFTVDAEHDGLAIEGANFQTPTDDVYTALRGLITGFVGKDPFDGGSCVVVTTVSDKKVVGMKFDEFIEFHPHGKPGATVAMDPPVATPIYFNADVLPDLAQTTVSNDGGVLWANVPPGEYTLSATLEGTSFATVHVTCAADWVVNASPVWGLHELP